MNSSNKIAIFDIDGTIIKGHIQKHLINYLWKFKRVDSRFIIKLTLWFFLYRLHLIRNLDSIFRYGSEFLRNKSVEEISIYIDKFILERLPSIIYKETLELISQYKKSGYKILLLSSVIEPLVSKLSPVFSADYCIGTKVEVLSGKYTGNIEGEVVYGSRKLDSLKNFCLTHNYSLNDSIAFADHKSDIILLKSVGKGYLVNPKMITSILAKRSAIDVIYVKS